jgi:hypothetical protein
VTDPDKSDQSATRDQYNIQGNANVGAVGHGASAHNVVFNTDRGARMSDDREFDLDGQELKHLSEPSRHTPTILFMSAAPKNDLRLDREAREIRTELELTKFGRQFRLELRPATVYKDLQRYVAETTPTILHFSGHGDVPGIILEKEEGDPYLVPGKALAKLLGMPFIKENLRLVVLNACLSETQARAIADEIDVVVGMASNIGDDAAIAFARGLYSGLGIGRDVASAFELGTTAIAIENLPEESTPQMIVRSGVDASQVLPLRKAPGQEPRPPPTQSEQTKSVDDATLAGAVPGTRRSSAHPYKGLEPFTVADADQFKGRAQAVDRLVHIIGRVPRPRFLLITGPSGSGKSSLIQAGLLARLKSGGLAGGIAGSDRWPPPIVTRPAIEIPEAVPQSGNEQMPFYTTAQAILNSLDERQHLILLVDQFEELFAGYTEELQQAFVTQLAALMGEPGDSTRITVAVVIRDDFYNRFTQLTPRSLVNWLEDEGNLFNIPPILGRTDLTEIVELPAAAQGVRFEPGLSDLLVDEAINASPIAVRDGSGAHVTVLPLLEFALTELWSHGQSDSLVLEDYQAIGGVRGALAQWADQAYRDLPETAKPLARRILTDLAFLRDENQAPDSRWRRRIVDLCRDSDDATELEKVQEVVRVLANKRLLVTSRDDQSDEVVVELIHDTLLRQWSILSHWLSAVRPIRLWQQHNARKVRDWVSSNQDDPSSRDPGWLLTGNELIEAEHLYANEPESLTKEERRFILASVQRRDQPHEWSQEEDKRRSILRSQFLMTESRDIHLGLTPSERRGTWSANHPMQLCILLAVESLRDRLTLEGYDQIRRLLPDVITVDFPHAPGTVTAVSFSKDGTLLGTSSSDWVARVIGVDEFGNQSGILRLRHDAAVSAVAFSPTSHLLVTGSQDATIRLWNLDGYNSRNLSHKLIEGPVPTRMFTSSWPVSRLEFRPDGHTLVSLGALGKQVRLHVWEVMDESMELIQLEQWTSPEGFTDAAISPDGRFLAAVGTGGLQVWETEGWRLVELPTLSSPRAIAFSNDGRMLAAGSATGGQVWVTDDWIPISGLAPGPARSIAFSADGSLVVAADRGQVCRILQIEPPEEIARVSFDAHVESVTISPDNRWVAAACGTDAHMIRWQQHDLIDAACSRVARNLTPAEWQYYFGDEPYRVTCPNAPTPDPEVWVGKGYALFEAGSYQEALEGFTHALTVQPDFDEALRMQECIESYLRGLELTAEAPTAWTPNNLEEAISAFNRAIDLKPDFTQAREKLAAALSDQIRIRKEHEQIRAGSNQQKSERPRANIHPRLPGDDMDANTSRLARSRHDNGFSTLKN